MDIQQLRYFNTVVHLENVSKAAETLHISQSALSKQIQRLENELGFPLFDRKGKKIILNKAGKRFYASSEQILRELRSASDDISMMVSRKNYRIRIGSPGLSSEMLKCISDFSSAHPGTIFVLDNRIDFEGSIDINRYDALICPDEFKFEKLNGYHLYDEIYHFAVNRKSKLADSAAFSFNLLKGQPVIFMHGDDESPEYPYRICNSSEFEPETIFFTDTRESHRRLIKQGSACGFVPGSESEAYNAMPEIKLLPILDPRFTRPMKICFLRENHLSELGLLFREHVIEHFGLS